MNRFPLILSLIFILLLQIFVCNNIDFFGFVNPYIYVAFVFLFPLTKNRFITLFTAFIYGLTIDFFSDTGAIHAFSLVLICFVRLFFLRLFFRKNDFDFLLFQLNQESFGKVFSYVITLTFMHHLVMFVMANFSLQNFTEVLNHSIYSTAFTVTLYFLGSFLFNRKTISS